MNKHLRKFSAPRFLRFSILTTLFGALSWQTAALAHPNCQGLFSESQQGSSEPLTISHPPLVQLAEMIVEVQDLSDGPLRTSLSEKIRILRQEMIRRHGPTIDSLLQELIQNKRQELRTNEEISQEEQTRDRKQIRRLENKAKERKWQSTASFGVPLQFVDNHHALFMSGPNEIRMIHVKSGQIKMSWQSPNSRFNAANIKLVISPNGKEAFLLQDTALARINLTSSHTVAWEPLQMSFNSGTSWSKAVLTPDLRYLVAARYGSEEVIIDLSVNPGKIVASKKANSTGLAGAAVSPDGQYAFAWHYLKPNLFYNLKSGQEVPTSRLALGDQLISRAQFVQGKDQLITLNDQGQIRRFDIKKNDWIGPDISKVSFLPDDLFVLLDSNHLLVSDWDRSVGRIRIFDLTRNVDLIEEMALVGDVTGKFTHVYLPDSRLVLLVEQKPEAGRPLQIKTIDLDTFEIHQAAAQDYPDNLRFRGDRILSSPDGEILIPSNYIDFPGYLE